MPCRADTQPEGTPGEGESRQVGDGGRSGRGHACWWGVRPTQQALPGRTREGRRGFFAPRPSQPAAGVGARRASLRCAPDQLQRTGLSGGLGPSGACLGQAGWTPKIVFLTPCAHMRAHAQAHVHTNLHAHTHACTHVHTHTHIHTHNHTHTHMLTHTHIRARARTLCLSQARIQIRTRMHTYTHTHTHMYTHTQSHTHTPV
jgi:hypothetical protein